VTTSEQIALVIALENRKISLMDFYTEQQDKFMFLIYYSAEGNLKALEQDSTRHFYLAIPNV